MFKLIYFTNDDLIQVLRFNTLQDAYKAASYEITNIDMFRIDCIRRFGFNYRLIGKRQYGSYIKWTMQKKENEK